MSGEAVVLAHRNDATGAVRLLGYVVPAATGGPEPAGPIDEAALRERAAAYLPDHMVPSAIVALPAFPTTANGKLDRAALPVPDVARPASAPRAARSEREELFCSLFGEVLGLTSVGPEDGFFDLGGDSILALRLVARGRHRGLAFTPADVFAHPTPAALALRAREVSDAERTEPPGAGTGAVPATPIMRWLEDGGGPYDAFAQAVVVRVPAGIREELLGAALAALVDTHDMLRMRVTGDGYVVRPAGGAPVRLRRVAVAAGELDRAVLEAAGAARRQLDPSAGEVLRAVLVEAAAAGGGAGEGRLLLVAHHLVVDGVSWRILLPDLAAAYTALERGEPVELTRGVTSYRRWAQHLLVAALGAERAAELGYWISVLDQVEPMFASGGADPREDRARDAHRRTVTVPADVTDALVTRVATSVHGTVQDVLLTALAVALNALRPAGQRTSGPGRASVVAVEGHGREGLSDLVDVSGTVGWFTSIAPVPLDPGPITPADVLAGRADLDAALKRVKEQVRAARDGGIGYGMLRYLNPETSGALADRREPEVLFNYLGQLDGELDAPAGSEWSLAPESRLVTEAADPDMPLRHALTVDAVVLEGELTATWTWAPSCCEDEQVIRLADSWVAVLRAIAEDAAIGGYTPSDLLIDLDQSDIDMLEETWGSLS